MKNKPQRVLARYNKMKAEKQPWIPMWTLVAEYVLGRKYPFTEVGTWGVNAPFLLDTVFDKTAGNACRLMASTLVGALWPNGAKTFQLDIPTSLEGGAADTEEVRSYYEWATKVMIEKMDHPRAGLLTSLEEYMGDQGGFGTSGMSAFENEDDIEVPVQYNSVNIKQAVIDEGKNGFVDTVYNELEYTVRQAVIEYGLDNLSKKVQDQYFNGDYDEKVRILHAVEPRMDNDRLGFGVQGMPIASIHIEIDTTKVIKESGYSEMPLFITRFWKTIGEKYGRSAAMEGLPDILEVNAMREASEIALEKTLDPPLMVLDDGGLGGGVIDTSAGAITVRTYSGRLGNQKPVEPLYTVGELNTTYGRIAELQEGIKNTFFVDRLLDLNNEQRMTAFETNIRDGLRGQSLGTIYARQMAELLSPLISRTFHILYRRGYLGVIRDTPQEQQFLEAGITPRYVPDALVKYMNNDREIFKIQYISPAARIMQNEEMLGIQKVTEYLLGVFQLKQDIAESVDFDYTLRRVQELAGAPAAMLYSKETIEKTRKKNQRLAAAAAQLQADRENSETARNMAQAAGTVVGAGLTGEGEEEAMAA